MKDYQNEAVPATGLAVPEQVTTALAEIAADVREGLLALAVGTGFQVLQTMLSADVEALCGPKGKHQPGRTAVRHGREAGSVTLGGRRVPVSRPRVRTADGSAELPIATYEAFAGTDLLGTMAWERMLAGLSTRRYRVGLEPVGSRVEQVASGTTKTSVSRRFKAATQSALAEMLAADLAGLDLLALMIDGVHFAETCCVVAMGIDAAGHKHPLALVAGSTENGTLVTELLVGLRDRGLDVTRPILVVIDGAKALRTAVNAVFDQPVVQRCQIHKIRNVEDKLPKALGATVATRMRRAYKAETALLAEAQLTALAAELDRTHPGAAASLREGLAETLTVLRLDLPPMLSSTLRSTNAIESMLSICRTKSRNVKRWQDETMAMRWCAAGMIEAGKQFRRVKGHLHLPALRRALDAHLADVGATHHTEEVTAA